MNNAIVTHFLGNNATFPADILVYIHEHHIFEEMRQTFLSFMLSKYSDFEKMPRNAEEVFENKAQKLATSCVDRAISKGVYNVTVEDFLSNNKGYKLFFEVIKGAMLEQANALLEEMNSFLAGAQQAEAVRDSRMTGTGFSVITNDIIGFGVWAAIEEHELRMQGQQADAEFRATIEAIEKQGKSTSQKRLRDYAAHKYLPGLKEAADSFAVDLFQTYINKLIEGNAFNREALNYNNITRAESILSNIKNASDKEQLIYTAFMQCPYCLRVYMEALNIGADIESTIATAKSFEKLDEIIHILDDKCLQISCTYTIPESAVIESLSHHAGILAVIHNRTTEEEIDCYLQERRKQNLTRINKAAAIEWNSQSFDTIMRMLIHKKVRVMLERRDNIDFNELFTSYIDKKTYGDSSPYYDAAKRFAVSQLVSAANRYLEIGRAHV